MRDPGTCCCRRYLDPLDHMLPVMVSECTCSGKGRDGEKENGKSAYHSFVFGELVMVIHPHAHPEKCANETRRKREFGDSMQSGIA